MNKSSLLRFMPFLLPLRSAQRKAFFYGKMCFDANRYAITKTEERLPVCLYEAQTLLHNANTGFDIRYQENKVVNLRLAAAQIDGVKIAPQETFSFWQLVKKVHRSDLLEGLSVENGKLTPAKGGGLCHLSNFLYWMFLHTPLTVTERHAHRIRSFPPPDTQEPDGVDATVSEGWLDLKVKNQTGLTLQIALEFEGAYLKGRVLASGNAHYRYEVFNRDKVYFKEDEKLFEQVCVCRRNIHPQSGLICAEERLYTDRFEIGHSLT